MKWTEIAFAPTADQIDAFTQAWSWRLEQPIRPFLSSMFGGVFGETPDGTVQWLECGTGLVEVVAPGRTDFDAFLGGERDAVWEQRVEEWFLTGLVARLQDAGLRPGPGQCYGLTVLPIFKGGTYTLDNIFVCPITEWFGLTGDLHRQVAELPDGAEVRLIVRP